MIEEDEGSYYLDFFSHNIGLVLFAAFVMAPVIPGYIAQAILIIAAATSGALSVTFFAIRRILLKNQMPGIRSSVVVAVTSEEIFQMFQVLGSTTLIMVAVLAWMGFAKMLWIFESFFVLFAAFHLINMMACIFMELAYTKNEVDEIKAALAKPETDSPE
jgi:hypothetical protein